jgi:hypothetical protein
MNAGLSEVLEDPRIWRAARRGRGWRTLPSGYPALDALLPGGGWPGNKVTEIAVERWGSGELALFMPLLARLCAVERPAEAGWIAWISPPFLPYAPALAAAGVELGRVLLVRGRDDAESLWAAEQALHSGRCRIVLAWARRVEGQGLRRLQLAAEAGQAPLILFRPPAALAAPSPAALRLSLCGDDAGACLKLLKHRGDGVRTLPVAALQAER